MSTNIKYLFFDFETSGIGNFKKQKAIQLAWVIADHNFNKMIHYFIIFPSFYLCNESYWSTRSPLPIL